MKSIALFLTLTIFTTTAHSAQLTAESVGGCIPLYEKKIEQILDRVDPEKVGWITGGVTAAGALTVSIATFGAGFLVFGLLGAGMWGALGFGAGYGVASIDRYKTYSKAIAYIGIAAEATEAELVEEYKKGGDWPGKYDYENRFISILDTDIMRPLKKKGINVSYDQIREKILELNQNMAFCPQKKNGKYKLANHRQIKRMVLRAFSKK